MANIHGVIPPVITPLTSARTLDCEGFSRIIEHVLAGGVSGIFVNGTAGEAMMVSHDVWLDTLRHAIALVDGRVPVFCGVIDASTARVMHNIKIAEQAGGTIFVATPAFYLENTCQDEIIRHYESIAGSTQGSVVMYNIPLTTHVNILPETVRTLSDVPNIVAYKDSAGDWTQFQHTIYALKDKPISLLDGAEALCAPSLLFGAQGLIPSLANFFPSIFVKMCEAARKKDIQAVYGLQKEVLDIRKSLDTGRSWMSALKYIGSRMGFCAEHTALPIQPLTQEQKYVIDAILDKYHFNKEV